MTENALDRAREFVYRNGRLLERRLFDCLFGDGAAEAVADAVRVYRNPDGGLGHGLEPDARAPHSMALHVEFGFRQLRLAGARDRELALGCCEFLSSVSEPGGRVPIVLPVVKEHPHANHWDFPIFQGDSPNPTTGLVGLLREQGAEHEWLTRAEAWCWARLEKPVEDAHEIQSTLHFLEASTDRARAEAVASRLAEGLAEATGYVSDPDSDRYGLTPLSLCPRPDSILRPGMDDALLERHLDALAAAQQEDGGWPIHFEPTGPAAVAEWRGHFTVLALATLRAWERL